MVIDPGRERACASSERRQTFPLSLAQRRLWLLDAMDPESIVYLVSSAFRLVGPLRVGALQCAVEALVERHASLRTTFAMQEGEPIQVVAERGDVTLRVIDLSESDPDQRETESRRIVADITGRSFDLAAGPLLRAVLLRLSPDDHILVLVRHHIINDARSNEIYSRDLNALYRAFVSGEQCELEPLTVQYGEYAAREHERLHGDVLARELAYWKESLAGAPSFVDLPGDRPRPPVQTFNGAVETRRLEPELPAAIAACARAHRCTPFMVLLAAYAALLHRYSGSNDLVIGSPIANRDAPELEGVIGFFVNTLALRIRIDPQMRFTTLIEHVRETVLGAFEHREIPFERLVEELRPQRSLAHPPLLNVSFLLQQGQSHPLELVGLRVEPFPLERTTVKFDLTLGIEQHDGRMMCAVGYKTDLFERETIVRMLDNFATVLAAAVHDPQSQVTDLPILSETERRRILVEWNDTARPFSAERAIHEIFEDVVQQTPEAVAASLGDANISYGELNARANRVARQLRARGVTNETPVAIAVEPSFEMLAGVLATLKAGGVYVPLDPRYPDERLRFIVRDSGAAVVLTQERLRRRLENSGVPIVVLDAAADENEGEPSENLAGALGGDAPAYVIYTSGTTGTPKGVVVPHRAVNRLVIGGEYVPFGPDLTIAQLSNFSFDAATFELWGALLHGARLVIVPKDVLLSPSDFIALLQRERIGAMFVTSALFQQLAHLSPSAFEHVRYVLVGGERVDPSAVNAVLSAARPEKVINAYGPTETTTFAATYDVEERGDRAEASIPIGRPIANTRLYVLDARRRPVPIGVVGELYIGGPGVALGYLNAPEQSAEKFVADPFCEGPYGVVYRTGDRARYRADGAVEFLGRLDRQVKIRGFRVEPQEVETILGAHPAVAAAVVDVEEATPADKRLVAYVVPAERTTVNGDELRAYLARTLPEYMLPSTVTVVDALPLTPNGKIDRDALRTLPQSVAAVPHDEERNPLELHLALLWQEVLGCGPISPTDDFFALGGHSLLAVVLMKRIEETFGRRVPVSALFVEPTIRHLARVLVDDARDEARNLLIPVSATGTQPPFFFLHGDLTGGGYYSRAVQRELGDDHPFYVFAPHGTDGRPAPRTIEEMAADYVATLREVRPQGPYRLGGFCSAGLIAFEMARLLERDGQRVDRLVLIDTPVRGIRYVPFADALAGIASSGGANERQIRALRTFVVRRLATIDRLAQAPWADRMTFLRRKVREAREGADDAPNGFVDAWRGLSAQYVPRRFDGEVTLLWCSARTAEERERLSRDWRAVTAKIAVATIPGDHLGSITSHLAQTAAVIARAVRKDCA